MPNTPAFAPLGRPGILLWLALSLCPGCAGEPQDDGPRDIVLIVIDTLRADHLGAYGYPRPTSPNLDALARNGIVFTDAAAPSSWTRPTMASLFTGLPPAKHGVRATTDPLDPATPTLAEKLQAHGYQTFGITANFVHITEVSGFDRGFKHFASFSEKATDSSDRLIDYYHVPVRAPTAREINEHVIGSFDYLESLGDLHHSPVFLYVHYMDPHSGYLAPASFQKRFAGVAQGPAATSDYVIDIASGRTSVAAAERQRLIDLYDAEIAYVDMEVGRLLAGLESRGVIDDAVIIVVSDHGEEFSDHGGWFHGATLHNELLHVPLIIHDRRVRKHRQRNEAVDLIDVSATVLALAGVEPEPAWPGRNLLARRIPPKPRVAELERDAVREERGVPVRHLRALTEGDWKALVEADGGITLYHVGRDPRETKPIPPDDASAPSELVARARELGRAALERRPATDVEITPEQREALRALGYAE